ncbi:ABC transporter substrate-binding protein [Bradyrhizobium sp. 166]|uniref:ABC transporter substrate-binding protein n=1 Tax=Bradyrhizobium sp. 166 TaxID=2782638 RepID=UPI001FFAB78A|nr:ABC transporter substrate-binding protein [Bradyrhizobium sp. 166]MCK1604780.1 ABC transporter substrate-binding protein [Bradyrhizobium sp. 166]
MLSRRKFSVGTLAGIGALAGGTVVRAAAQTKTFTLAVPSMKPGLDPAFAVTFDLWVTTKAIFSTLTELSPQLEPKPLLAESWKLVDPLKWTFRIRRDVRFHNGRELTTEDVAFSMTRLLDEKTGALSRSLLGPVASVTADDKYTVSFNMTVPFADMPYTVSQPYSAIVAKENVDKLMIAPIGSGPFILKQYDSGNSVLLSKNPDYFQKGQPQLDEVRMVLMKSMAVQASALSSGEIDMMLFAPAELVATLKADNRVKVVVGSPDRHQPIVMFAQKKPTDDPRVRKALRLASNRENALSAAAFDVGSIGNDVPAAPKSPWASGKLQQRTYDPVAAKKLLTEAGYPNGVDMVLYTSKGRPGLEEASIAYQQSAVAAGIRVNIKSIDIQQLYVQELSNPREFTMAHINWGAQSSGITGEPFSQFVKTDAAYNYARYSNPKLDEMLLKAGGVFSKDERTALYDQIQEILWEEGPEVIPYFAAQATAMRRIIQGYEFLPDSVVDLKYLSFV